MQEETLGRFTKYPMLMGPARETSEKILKNMKASLKFYGSWANFYLKFQAPWAMAMEEIYKETAEMMKGEVSPGDYKAFYTLWMKTYEKTFDKFLRSEEFSSDLGAFVSDFTDFKKNYEDILEDHLKKMSIPTKSDLEAAFKDIYTLKKKVRELSTDLKKANEEIASLKKVEALSTKQVLTIEKNKGMHEEIAFSERTA